MPIHRWCAVLLLLVCFAPLRLAAQETGTDDAVSVAYDASFRFYPTPLWSRSSGFAAGIGYEIENGLIPHDRLLFTATPGQHRGRYTGTYFAGDPHHQSVYGVVHAYYETTGRHWYYGTGPATSERDQVAVEKTRADFEVRAGAQTLDRRIFVQPVWSYVRHASDDVRNWEELAYLRLDPESRRTLDAALGRLEGTARRQSGYSFGVDGGIDLRDRPVRARRGLLVEGSVRRYHMQEPSDFKFMRFEAGLYGYFPMGPNVLRLRALLQRLDADGDVVPFYFLPTLDGRIMPGFAQNRFVGRDLFALTLEYAVPLFQLFDYAAMDALFSVGAGSVYDDISEQFDPAVRFKETLSATRDTYPLRPSIALGVDLQSYTPGGWDVRLLLGWSPEGIRLVKFGFVHDLRDVELNKR